MKRYKAYAIFLLLPTMLKSQDTCSVTARIFEYERPLLVTVSDVFRNPALKTYQYAQSLSEVGADMLMHREGAPVDPQNGDGETSWRAGADTYIKHKNSTLWGNAFYSRGGKSNVLFNESADADIIYPYFTADSVGGDIDFEKYSLGGGYAGEFGRWHLGACLSYDAGLHYRNIDPRPKNVTGALDFSVGASYDVGAGYQVGISLSAWKYKQTNDVMFVGETGKIPLYHLTGMGNHYYRFAGASSTAFYSGARYSVTANILPKNLQGLAATVQLSRMHLGKQLVDLNRLPLCRLWHKYIKAQAGYLGRNYSVGIAFEAYRRHGIENIFGDATSGVYPLIGSLEMYADNHYALSLNGAYEHRISRQCAFDMYLTSGYSHRSTLYAEPAAENLTNGYFAGTRLRIRAVAADKWNLEAMLGGWLSQKSHDGYSLTMTAVRALDTKYALGLSCAMIQQYYGGETNAHTLRVSLKLIF